MHQTIASGKDIYFAYLCEPLVVLYLSSTFAQHRKTMNLSWLSDATFTARKNSSLGFMFEEAVVMIILQMFGGEPRTLSDAFQTNQPWGKRKASLKRGGRRRNVQLSCIVDVGHLQPAKPLHLPRLLYPSITPMESVSFFLTAIWVPTCRGSFKTGRPRTCIKKANPNLVVPDYCCSRDEAFQFSRPHQTALQLLAPNLAQAVRPKIRLWSHTRTFWVEMPLGVGARAIKV